ncbi:AB hydrolase superfamily protein [Abortiporus biennis]
MSQYVHLSRPLLTDQDLADALAKYQPPKGGPVTDPATMRQNFNLVIKGIQDREEKYLPSCSDYRVEEHDIIVDVSESGTIKTRCLVPTPDSNNASAKSTFPIMVWFHAGAYIVGNLDTEDYFLRRLCVAFKLIIVNVDYRLAPEHIFPTSLNDGYAALRWVILNASLYWSTSPDEDGIILGGCSAGGNLAASAALLARDDPFFKEHQVALRGQILQMPMTIHPDAKPEEYQSLLLSVSQNENAPIFSTVQLNNIMKLVQPPPTDPSFSVVLAPSHKNLPPTYIQVCGLDPLRDEGLICTFFVCGIRNKYASFGLTHCNHCFSLIRYPGLPHRGHLYFPEARIAERVENDIKEGLRWLLQQWGGFIPKHYSELSEVAKTPSTDLNPSQVLRLAVFENPTTSEQHYRASTSKTSDSKEVRLINTGLTPIPRCPSILIMILATK